MASQDDYFDLFAKKRKSQPSGELDQAAMLLNELQNKTPWPHEYNMASSFDDTVVDDAASMDRISELRALGPLGFIQKYGLGPRAKAYLKSRGEEIDTMQAGRIFDEMDAELKRGANRNVPGE